jgi:hypothetical protein
MRRYLPVYDSTGVGGRLQTAAFVRACELARGRPWRSIRRLIAYTVFDEQAATPGASL